MNGSDFYTAVQSLVTGFTIDQILFYQMLNTARVRRQLMRPWMRLRKFQFSQTVGPASAPVVFPPPSGSLTIPTDFMFFARDGEITLYDNNLQFETYTEIGLDIAIPYMQVNNVFFADHGNGLFYLLGTIQKQYTAFLQYQAELGNIAASTTWLNIPSIFHMILAFDVAAMYRLGMDYDDINARNADDNNKQAELLFGAMVSWDDNLQRSATTRMNLPVITDVPGSNFQRKINMDAG